MPITQIYNERGMKFQQYANDTQLYKEVKWADILDFLSLQTV